MTALYIGSALFLLVNILIGLAHVLRGPTVADRMLSGEIMGTAAVAILLLLAAATGVDALLDVALVFALLSAMAVITFVSRAWPAAEDDPGEDA